MIAIILAVLLHTSELSSASMLEIRVSFYQAATEVGQREDFYELMKSLPKSSPLVKAYFGASQAMMAEVVFNPYSKLNYFVEGKKSIEEAIAERPADAELRYIRYLIQSNAPDFLAYSSNIPEDLRIINTAIENVESKQPWMTQFEQYRSLQKATYEANRKS